DGEAPAGDGQMSLFANEAKLAEGQLPLQEVLEALRPALTNPDIPKVAHNAKFDYGILDQYGVQVTPLSFDTMIAEWLNDPASKFLGLKNMAHHYLGIAMQEITGLIGRGSKQVTFAEVPIEDAVPYGAADADMTLRLVPILQRQLQEKGLDKLMAMEMELLPVLSAMEREGVGIDEPFFKALSAELEKRLG